MTTEDYQRVSDFGRELAGWGMTASVRVDHSHDGPPVIDRNTNTITMRRSDYQDLILRLETAQR